MNALFIYFTASVGGLLGLGVGFSFISIIELLYFFGVRRLFSNNQSPDSFKNPQVLRIRPRKPVNRKNVNRQTPISMIGLCPN